jgi:hypothetical protein
VPSSAEDDRGNPNGNNKPDSKLVDDIFGRTVISRERGENGLNFKERRFVNRRSLFG